MSACRARPSKRSGLQPAFKAALKQGWEISVTGSAHLKWMPPNPLPPPARSFVITSLTPTDRRASHRALKDLKKAGLQI